MGNEVLRRPLPIRVVHSLAESESPDKERDFNEFNTSPRGECWKMSAELNSKIGAQLGSTDADARGPKPMAGDESEVPVTQA